MSVAIGGAASIAMSSPLGLLAGAIPIIKIGSNINNGPKNHKFEDVVTNFMMEQLIEAQNLIMTKQGKLAFVHDGEHTLLNDNPCTNRPSYCMTAAQDFNVYDGEHTLQDDNPGANRSSYCVTATHDLNVKKQGKLSFVHNGEHTLQDDNPGTDHSSCCIGCFPFKKKNKIDYQC